MPPPWTTTCKPQLSKGEFSLTVIGTRVSLLTHKTQFTTGVNHSPFLSGTNWTFSINPMPLFFFSFFSVVFLTLCSPVGGSCRTNSRCCPCCVVRFCGVVVSDSIIVPWIAETGTAFVTNTRHHVYCIVDVRPVCWPAHACGSRPYLQIQRQTLRTGRGEALKKAAASSDGIGLVKNWVISKAALGKHWLQPPHPPPLAPKFVWG